MSSSYTKCLLCAHHELTNLSPKNFVGVTSDCKPWPRAGELCVCQRCGHVQKLLSPQWLADAAKIYEEYEMYPLSELAEQVIWAGDRFVSRNAHLASKLAQAYPVQAEGRILDLGCGNGGFLHAFSQLFPKWTLFGCEQQGSRRDDIMKLPAVGGFYQGNIENIDQKFECISLVYVIEHLFDPKSTLRGVRNKLADDGFVFIKTADLRTSPFDLTVADHCHHFTLEMLQRVLQDVGFAVKISFSDWVDKEIGLIAVPSEMHETSSCPSLPIKQVEAIVLDNIEVLRSLHDNAVVNSIRPLGVLGTAISATWLVNQLGEGQVAFFVDEDESKVGKGHMGIPVIRLADAPECCAICIPFPTKVADRILKRVKVFRPDITFLT